jgi:drug/metabolite transporter (DMT)-like permease
VNPGVLWGLATAAAWGTADFAGGLASRRAVPVVVTAASQAIGLAALVVAAIVLRPPLPAWEAMAVGALAGVGGGLGLAFLYEGLARGAMGIVSSLAGAGAVVIPLVVSLVTGTSIAPLAFVGIGLILLAGLAAADVSRDAASRAALLLALGAAVGFASWYLLIDLVADEGRLWVLVASRSASSLLLAAIVLGTRAARDGIPSLRAVLPFVALAGMLDVGANVFFVLARGDISVALAATISGLYPLFTMTLARIVLGERLPRLGLLAVAMAVGGTILISVAR